MYLFVWYGAPCLPHFAVVAGSERQATDIVQTDIILRVALPDIDTENLPDIVLEAWKRGEYVLEVYEANDVVVFNNQ